MFVLLEVTYTDKESQALYTNYTTETELIGALESKLGLQMKDNNCMVEQLIAFDHTGKILSQAYHTKDDTIVLSNRLVWITADIEGEHPNMQKYDTATQAEAYYHIRRGDAMGNADVKAILTMAIGEMGVTKNEYWVRPIEIVGPEA